LRKIIFLDIDGTLTGYDGWIPPSVSTACRSARSKGHLLYICSGRPRLFISKEILDIGFDGVISAGGAYIEAGNNIILNAMIPVETVINITNYLNLHKCGFLLEKSYIALSSHFLITYWENIIEGNPSLKRDIKFIDFINRITENQLPENPEPYHYEGINKMVFMINNEVSFDDVKQAIGINCEIFRGSVPYCGNEGGEIGPPGIHKGSAVERIAEYHGISLDDTIAFGDSDNDRKMIERAGIGIAMGNASADLKTIADDVTNSFDNDGIFNGFVKYGLISEMPV